MQFGRFRKKRTENERGEDANAKPWSVTIIVLQEYNAIICVRTLLYNFRLNGFPALQSRLVYSINQMSTFKVCCCC